VSLSLSKNTRNQYVAIILPMMLPMMLPENHSGVSQTSSYKRYWIRSPFLTSVCKFTSRVTPTSVLRKRVCMSYMGLSLSLMIAVFDSVGIFSDARASFRATVTGCFLLITYAVIMPLRNRLCCFTMDFETQQHLQSWTG
jgi:hypothetical protein